MAAIIRCNLGQFAMMAKEWRQRLKEAARKHPTNNDINKHPEPSDKLRQVESFL